MKRILLIGWICLPWALAAQQWHTTLDVLRPAERVIPSDIHNLLIVNNTVSQPATFGHSVLVDGNVAGNVDIDLQEASPRMLFAVTETLDRSGLFDNVGLLEVSQNRTGNFYQLALLPQEQVTALCRDYESDAVLVCNRNVLFDALESFPLEDGEWYALLTAYETHSWTLQYPDGKGTGINYILTDTLYWEAQAYTREQALAQLPDRRTALTDMATYVGERFAAAFVPQWEAVDRYFYENDHAEVQAGMRSFERQRWEEAIAHWKKAYEDKDSRTKAYAAADMAVTYEILDDLKAATAWTQRAMDSFSKLKSADALQQKVNLAYYLQQLRIRQAEQKRLL